MFTGIITEVGTVESLQASASGARLVVSAPGTADDAAVGDSVAVEGCCLTVTDRDGHRLGFHAVPETLRRTSLGALAPGDPVNLEPALQVGDRMGGHWVQGHVDGVGRVLSVTPDGDGLDVDVAAPPDVLRYTVHKGSICVAGASLTVTAVDDRCFSVSLIPHTLAATTLGRLQPGDTVNLEADLLGKYVERLAGGTLQA
ncbi:MAG TPA: riboflavin synthase [Gaiellales bacterium]|nr:riboflavin synthase [Gaiellales bacterium]